MKTIKERHFIIEYVVPESDEEEMEIKKIVREVASDRKKVDLSKFVRENPEGK